MKRYFIALAACAPLAALAADNPDASFYKHAAEGGLAEVNLGNLAQQKSSNPAVKQFAAKMVQDHSAADDKLNSIAMSKNITLPTTASVGQMATKAKLEVLSGNSFDQSYIKGMIKDHRQTIAEFRKEARSGRDPDAKAFAKATLPTLEEHLKMIEKVSRENQRTAKAQ